MKSLIISTMLFLTIGVFGEVVAKPELLKEASSGRIYWVMNGKKYYVTSPDVLSKMISVPGWEKQRVVDSVPGVLGPDFYHKDQRSDGLLIKRYGNYPAVYLIEGGRKREFADEYSFENFKFKGRFLDWNDIIWVSPEVLNDFPNGQRIELAPILTAPSNGSEFSGASVTLQWKSENSSWNHHLQVDDSSDFISPIVDGIYPSSSHAVTLSPGKYFWRVRAEKNGRQPSKWSKTGYFEIRQAEHKITIVNGPTANPSIVDSGGSVSCSISAVDSLGHSLSYIWNAPVGWFDNPNSPNTIWHAPQNTSGSIKTYTLTVTVRCSEGKTATGEVQVSVRSQSKKTSVITVQLSSDKITLGDVITISGSINPPHSANVTLKFFAPSGASIDRGTVATSSGNYTYEFEPDHAGKWQVTASWDGDSDHEGATSNIASFNVKRAPSKIRITHVDRSIMLGDPVTIEGEIKILKRNIAD